jgi:predicted HAD superfamily Cof-like phosphohydrolase
MRSVHQQRVDLFHILAQQGLGKGPHIPSSEVRELRARLILEEALETIKALGFDVFALGPEHDLHVLIDNIEFNPNHEPDLIEIADGCADIRVVTTGTLTACGIDDEELQEAVDLNNLAKFGPGGYRRDDGKWIKPPDHKPPDIRKILTEQQLRLDRIEEVGE